MMKARAVIRDVLLFVLIVLGWSVALFASLTGRVRIAP